MVDETLNHFRNPLLIEERINALLSEYSSASEDCPFYNESLYSKCSLDAFTIHLPPCKGRCFNRGFCCDRVEAMSRKNVMRKRQIFPEIEEVINAAKLADC